jgi:hypothetical protein
LLKQSQLLVKPFPTPPFPAQSSTLAGSRQVAPNLFLNPLADERETPAGMTYRKVVHPPTHDRIDLRDQSTDRLGLEAPEDDSQFSQ